MAAKHLSICNPYRSQVLPIDADLAGVDGQGDQVVRLPACLLDDPGQSSTGPAKLLDQAVVDAQIRVMAGLPGDVESPA